VTEKTTLAQIDGLNKLARNLYWSWHQDAKQLFEILSPNAWESTSHNAVAVLSAVSKAELTAKFYDAYFEQKVKQVLAEFHAYMDEKETWNNKHSKISAEHPVVYFSAEFGIHESLPIYSGGLGILAGDHIKSASDLGVPFVGISLFYRQGYFTQRISPDGWQQELYPLSNPDKMPLELVRDKYGKPLLSSVVIGQTEVYFQAWLVQVGRAKLYLIDANVPENEPYIRDITGKVYGGDATTRIQQEMLLGIGGTRLVKALGIEPSVYHMNEGHAAFATLTLLAREIKSGKSPEDAQAAVKAQCIFTTHTPVPAGHDRFSPDLMQFAFGRYARENFNMDMKDLMAFGRVNPNDEHENFTMTVLALKMSHAANGVSELHGEVSRDMWKDLYGKPTEKGVPIGSITNGIHTFGWMTRRTEKFWQSHFAKTAAKDGNAWREDFMDEKKLSSLVAKITDEELWSLRYMLKRDLVEFARTKLKEQNLRVGGDGVGVFDNVLSPDVLTIGFARRFATYKRAPLLFKDLERISRIINSTERPMQILFAGKAHPKDDAGKVFIQQIIGMTRIPQFFGKVVFLENYDINVARHLVSGVDIWLNNPLRPLEASGTSGMKVTAHGGLNCSILDGWWREGYNGKNGWAIGKDESVLSPEEQDYHDALSLYDILENDLVPLYYNRDARNIPVEWLKKVRHAMATLVPQFSTHRMVKDYVQKYYVQG
jgi:starch phosphorylase